MSRKIHTTLIVTIFVIVNFLGTINLNIEVVSADNWLYVGGSGSGNYTSIQNAIDNATDGDTVYVYSGTYDEQLIINKSISLVGEGRETTFLKTKDTYEYKYETWATKLTPIILISSDEVKVTGFNISYDGSYEVYYEESDVTVSSYHHAYQGIILDSVKNCKINNNILLIDSYDCSCIYFESSQNNVIEDNVLSSRDYGIFLSHSSDNQITNNDLFGRSIGVQLYYPSENQISYNEIGARFGSCLEFRYDCDRNTITYNTLYNTTRSAYSSGANSIRILSSNDNLIHHNNLTAYYTNHEYPKGPIHYITVYSDGNNQWDDGQGEGNYWADYKKHYPHAWHDETTWSEPYVIGEESKDNYPLAYPVGEKGSLPFYPAPWMILVTSVIIILGIVSIVLVKNIGNIRDKIKSRYDAKEYEAVLIDGKWILKRKEKE